VFKKEMFYVKYVVMFRICCHVMFLRTGCISISVTKYVCVCVWR